MRSLMWCFVLAACGKDVQLGVAPDAPVDALLDSNTSNPFTAGTYAVAFVDPNMRMCDGDLAGSEDSFESITGASLSFVDGTVTFATPDATLLVVTGAVIDMGFGAASLEMRQEASPPPGEPPVWGTEVEQDFGAGPLSTQNTRRLLVLDTGTAASSPVLGFGAALYENAGATGACTVGFSATFTPQ